MDKIEILRCTHLADQALLVAIDVNFKLLDQDQLLITDTTVIHHVIALADRLKSCLVKMNIGHPVSKSKFRTLVKVNLGRRTSR
jgi:hypothetical protein